MRPGQYCEPCGGCAWCERNKHERAELRRVRAELRLARAREARLVDALRSLVLAVAGGQEERELWWCAKPLAAARRLLGSRR